MRERGEVGGNVRNRRDLAGGLRASTKLVQQRGGRARGQVARRHALLPRLGHQLEAVGEVAQCVEQRRVGRERQVRPRARRDRLQLLRELGHAEAVDRRLRIDAVHRPDGRRRDRDDPRHIEWVRRRRREVRHRGRRGLLAVRIAKRDLDRVNAGARDRTQQGGDGLLERDRSLLAGCDRPRDRLRERAQRFGWGCAVQRLAELPPAGHPPEDRNDDGSAVQGQLGLVEDLGRDRERVRAVDPGRDGRDPEEAGRAGDLPRGTGSVARGRRHGPDGDEHDGDDAGTDPARKHEEMLLDPLGADGGPGR